MTPPPPKKKKTAGVTRSDLTREIENGVLVLILKSLYQRDNVHVI